MRFVHLRHLLGLDVVQIYFRNFFVFFKRLDDVLDLLVEGRVADEQGVAGIDDDEVADADERGQAAGVPDEAVLGVEGQGVAPDGVPRASRGQISASVDQAPTSDQPKSPSATRTPSAFSMRA